MTTLIPKFDLKNGGSTPTGAINRAINEKLAESISVKDFGAIGDGAVDDTVALQAALTYASTNGKTLYIPTGKYRTTAQLNIGGSSATPNITIVGEGIAFDGSIKGATIFYDGAANTATSVIYINALSRVSMTNLQIFGNAKAGNCIRVTPDGGSFASYGWYFEHVNIQGASQYGFTIEGSSNGARFNFQSCDFYNNGIAGFYNNNSNSLNHNFTACSFSLNGQYGIWNAQGSYKLYSCEFAVHSIADNYIQICSNISIIGCWTEQSNRFVLTDVRQDVNSLSIINCQIASYPWSYWKYNNETTPQPTNDYTQWVAIIWDGYRGGLSLIGNTFSDPWNGASKGAIAPLTSSTILVASINTIGVSPNFTSLNTYSQTGTNTFTDIDFFYYGSGKAALKLAQLQQYNSNFSLTYGPTATFNPINASTGGFLLSGNVAVTINTTQSSPGDKLTIVFKQDAIGGRTVTFVNALIAGGSFVPTATANAISGISFEFDGTNWQERSRALNLS